jgi:hypothetical protein
VGWSLEASSEGLGVRCTMEWRLKEGVTRIRGMWKTFAESLSYVSYHVDRKWKKGTNPYPITPTL